MSWHGHRIRAAYGDPAHIEDLLDEIPEAIDEVVRGLQAVAAPEGRGLRLALVSLVALTLT